MAAWRASTTPSPTRPCPTCCASWRADAAVVGMIAVTREAPGPWAEHHVQLLRTFADQAVIAIENVRLFNETQEALERQKASADVLGVISGSMGNAAPVLDTILAK